MILNQILFLIFKDVFTETTVLCMMKRIDYISSILLIYNRQRKCEMKHTSLRKEIAVGEEFQNQYNIHD